MERALNPKDDKQTIYEIYRACRLCGAGAGYKMPIIQKVVDLEGDGIELRQKIKECAQIEVNDTDRMPPLICEFCVDKVNEFYEFLNICKQTNTRTRLRLGLPLQTRTRNSADIEIIRKESANNVAQEPHLKRQRGKTKEPDVGTKMETSRSSPKPEAKPRAPESRESSEEPRWTVISRGRRIARSPSPSPKRTTRQNADVNFTPQVLEEPEWTSRSRHVRSPSPSRKRTTRQSAELNLTPQLIETLKSQSFQNSSKNVLKKSDESLAVEKSKLKRSREKETKVEAPPPNKKAKILSVPVKIVKPGPMSSKNVQKENPEPKLISKTQAKPQPPPKKDPKPSPVPPSKALPAKATPSKVKSSRETPPKSEQPFCEICKIYLKNAQGSLIHNYMKHSPNFTSPRHACNACELWFPTIDEANAHHRNHKNQNIPYKCTRCYGYFKLQQAYDDHFGNALCLSVYEVPDVKCWECWRTFPTNKLMEEHRCLGEDGRPGGKCNKCSRVYALLKNLVKHESTCTYKKKGTITVDPEVQAQILPMQVRVARCDSLLKTKDHVDSSKVPLNYGLDSKCVYPYLSHIKVKSEPTANTFSHVRSIKYEDVKEEFCDSYTHWDSDSDVSDSASVDTQKQINTLSTISLKSKFSKKRMSKAPKRCKVTDETFESFNDFGMGKKIDSIIDDLGNDDAQTSCDSDSILDKDVTTKNDKEQSKDIKKDENVLKDDGQTGCSSDSVLDENGVIKVENNNDEVSEIKIEDINDDIVDKCNVAETQNESDARDYTNVKGDCTPKKLDSTVEKLDDTREKLDSTTEKLDTREKLDSTTEKLDTREKLDSTTEKLDTGEKLDSTTEKLDTGEKLDSTTEKLDTGEKLDSTTEKLDTGEKLDSTTEKLDTREKLDSTAEKLDTKEKLDSTTEKLDTRDKLDGTTEKLVSTSEKHDETPAKYDTLKKLVGTTEKLDSTSDKLINTLEKSDSVLETTSGTLENPEKNMKDDSEKEDNHSIIENNMKSVSEKDDNSKTIEENNVSNEEISDANTENSNLDSSCHIDGSNTQHYKENDSNLGDNNQSIKLEDQEIENEPKNDEIDSNNKLSSNDLLNSNSDNNDEKMDVDEQNVPENDHDVINHETKKDSNNPTEIDENFSKIDEITSKILNETQSFGFNQTSTKTEDLTKVFADQNSYNDESHQKSKVSDNQNSFNEEGHQKSDTNSDSISLNSIGNDIATENRDKFNVNDLNEDDRKLMAELDAQIGENDHKINDNNQSLIENDQKCINDQELDNQPNEALIENDQKSPETLIDNDQKFSENEKLDLIPNENDQKQNDQRTKDYLIDNLLKKQDNDLKSLDLDSISDDEFNFDI